MIRQIVEPFSFEETFTGGCGARVIDHPVSSFGNSAGRFEPWETILPRPGQRRSCANTLPGASRHSSPAVFLLGQRGIVALVADH